MKNNTVIMDIEISPQAKKLAKESEGMLAIYENYEIATSPQYTIAVEDLKKIKAKSKELDDLRRSMTRPLDEAKKKIMDFFRHPQNLLIKAEYIIKQAMITFDNEQKRIRIEAELKAQEQAKKEEEKQRKRLEVQAQKAEAKGNIEKAEQLKEQINEVHIPAPIIPDQTPKVQGVQYKEIWKAKVIDVNKLPREYMIPNEKMLNDFAKATKGLIDIPGVEFYTEKVVASTSK